MAAARYQLSMPKGAPGRGPILEIDIALLVVHFGAAVPLDRLGEERGEAVFFDEGVVGAIPEGAHILRGGALRLVAIERAGEDLRVRRVGDDEPADPIGPGDRRAPGDRAAPIMAAQGEAIDLERIGKRDQILDDLAGLVILDALGLVGLRKAALVRRDAEMVVLERIELMAPGAMRLRKTVEEDDRVAVLGPFDRHIERDAGRQGDLALVEVSHSLFLSKTAAGRSSRARPILSNFTKRTRSVALCDYLLTFFGNIITLGVTRPNQTLAALFLF